MIGGLFPREELSGITFREVQSPGSPIVTVLFVREMVRPGELERLVLAPLAGGVGAGSPEELMRSGRIPAPELVYVRDVHTLLTGLLDGLVAIHIDGYAGCLLAGGDRQEPALKSFGPDLEANVSALRRQLRYPDVQVERHVRADGARVALVYLKQAAQGATVRAVRRWSLTEGVTEAAQPMWRAVVNHLRLPPALESLSPADVAKALTRGYICVVRDDRGAPLVAPTTLDRLFSGPGDVALIPALARLAPGYRVIAALLGLTLGAVLVAVSSYHHGLIPGPFLAAMGTSRANLPLPVVGEIVIASVLGDAFQAGGAQLGGRSMMIVALAAFILAMMAMMQVGVIGAVSGAVAIVDGAVRGTLPGPALQRVTRLWRYLCIGAAAGLGMYGLAIFLFLMMVYLGEERAVEHPVRLPPTALSR